MSLTPFRPLARRIITHEQRAQPTPHDIAAAAVRVYTTLSMHLSAILGEKGGAELFRRSLRLAETTYPVYSAVREVQSDTLLSAVGSTLQSQGAQMAREASVELLAIHIELLATFIGQRLVEQLLREAWPDVYSFVSEERPA